MVRVIGQLDRLREDRFREDRRGVTAIEYALMAGAIAVALVLAMANLNGGVSTALHKAANAFPT